MDNDFFLVFKVLLLGDSTVGKTCLLLKYTDKIFKEEHMMTIGLDYRLKRMKLKNGKEVKLQIWDTAGQDRFRSITKNFYKGTHGIILIYDVTNEKTFENAKSWVEQIHEEISDKVVIYLVGNKIDMEEERKVSTEEGKKLAEELGIPFFETSAKTGENIDNIFDNIVEDLDKEFGNIQKIERNLSYQPKKEKKCCN